MGTYCGNAAFWQCGIVAKANAATRVKRSRAFANRGIRLCRNAAVPHNGIVTLWHLPHCRNRFAYPMRRRWYTRKDIIRFHSIPSNNNNNKIVCFQLYHYTRFFFGYGILLRQCGNARVWQCDFAAMRHCGKGECRHASEKVESFCQSRHSFLPQCCIAAKWYCQEEEGIIWKILFDSILFHLVLMIVITIK